MLPHYQSLPPCQANYAALTPITFVERTAQVYPDRTSVIYGSTSFTWAETLRRCKRLASALLRCSVSVGDTVSVVAPNIPAMYEAHFGIPMVGAVINCINIRLDARTVSVILKHSAAKAILVDAEFFNLVDSALSILGQGQQDGPTIKRPLIVIIEDDHLRMDSVSTALEKGAVKYEDFLQSGDPNFKWTPPKNEWQSISV
eukprot:c29076_g1_i4 orf=1-600(-)